jgi:GNAT superfamily N-acetyltransferase
MRPQRQAGQGALGTDVVTRAAGQGDAACVDDLLGRSYGSMLSGSYPPAILDRVLPLINRANPTLLGAGTYYIAMRNGVPLGCGGWSFDPPGGGISEREAGLAHLRHFAVVPEAVGRGVGRALFLRCRGDAWLLGARRLEVLSTLNAEGFYLALGFRPLGQVTVALPGGVPFASIRMQMALA